MRVVRGKLSRSRIGVCEAARQLADQGRLVLVLGRPGQAEVRSVVKQVPKCEVVPDAESVRAYHDRRLAVVIPSTIAPDQLREIWAHIQLLNPLADIRFVDAALFLRPDARHDEPRARLDSVSGVRRGSAEGQG